MVYLSRLVILTGLLSVNLSAATIDFSVSTVGVNPSGETLYRYLYSLAGVSLLNNQEVDIRFGPVLYGTLSNGVAPAGFNLQLLQPNNPPGASGDYSVLALLNNPPVSGVFSV